MDEKREKSIFITNISHLAIIQALTYLSPLIITPFLFRILNTETFGLFFFGNSFVFYFIVLIDFGFEIYGSKEVASLQNNRLKVSRIICSIFYIKFALFFLALIVYFLMLKFSSIPIIANHKYLYLINSIQLIGTVFSCTWVYQGFQKLKTLTYINVVFRITYVLVVLILIKGPSDLILLALIYSLSVFGVAFMSFVFISKFFKISLVLPDFIYLKSVFKSSIWYFLSRVSTSVYTTSNTFILGIFAGPKAVAIYSAAEKIYFAAQSLIQPINGAIIPFLTKTKSIKSIKKYIFPLFVIVIFGAFMGMVFGHWFLDKFYGSTDDQMVIVFKILIIVLAITIPSILIGYPLLVAIAKKDKLANTLVFYGAVIHLLILTILILSTKIGPINIALSLLVTESFLLLSRLFYLGKFKLLNG